MKNLCSFLGKILIWNKLPCFARKVLVSLMMLFPDATLEVSGWSKRTKINSMAHGMELGDKAFFSVTDANGPFHLTFCNGDRLLVMGWPFIKIRPDGSWLLAYIDIPEMDMDLNLESCCPTGAVKEDEDRR